MSDKIFEFDPAIYPMRIWVTKEATREELLDTFYFLDENEEVVDNPKIDEGRAIPIASTFTVAHKENGWMGCLVVIRQPKKCGAGVCAHEASHCTDYLCDKLGVKGFSYDEGEARAYFLQWATICIFDVLTKKKEK